VVEAALGCLPEYVKFVGGHPMAGSERSGPEASDADLFSGAVYVLTPAGDVGAVDALSAFLSKYLRCRTAVFDAATHDSIAAAVSHLPHILASALVLCAREQEKSIPGTLLLAAGGFRDMTRIASARYDIWHDIFATNKEAIIPLMDSYINILNEMKTLLAKDALKERFEEARAVKESM
jgi:prephenate dehydrogenase